ncbi:uncharacterized protein T551_01680 [Pneumocystis jirovecii RU7]|uniref:Sphingolipid long chain base-responsive protein LSP1 n=1 Tax=Pneumocystis jirovecii (strain RU7) TaxID=1408657 RepID=A0A0W4ZPV1_PNEJ7|nr:uncharacterized protein T551_01680 [Pneumocystis jirovecii RU7]KTW30397.1 hypothetical protein T551_01680 [Pneumocystis jirovecii RU7]
MAHTSLAAGGGDGWGSGGGRRGVAGGTASDKRHPDRAEESAGELDRVRKKHDEPVTLAPAQPTNIKIVPVGRTPLRGNATHTSLPKLIKTENGLIAAYEAAGREQQAVASQLSQWGEETGDDAIGDLSDKVAVILSEIGDLEENHATQIDDSRRVLKTIRNIENSVQPLRDAKQKLTDQIAMLKHKDPESSKLVEQEQRLVRLEAENLVAEAQLTHVSRQKLKEAYNMYFLSVQERAEKQCLLSYYGRKLLDLLDDNPVIPGDIRIAYESEKEAKELLLEAEEALQSWRPGQLSYEREHASDPNLVSERSQDSFSKPEMSAVAIIKQDISEEMEKTVSLA